MFPTPANDQLPLGLKTARLVIELGRGPFFGALDADLPPNRQSTLGEDDQLPQFGYVGSRYQSTRLLVLGINPGNGPNNKRTRHDEILMPRLRQFVLDREAQSFLEAQRAFQTVCSSWPMWRRHCSAVIGAGGFLTMDDIAYSNCLPWRTASESAFGGSVSLRAAEFFAYPLIDELQPRTIVAMGKKAASILAIGGRSFADLIVWNRSQAATSPVLKERALAAERIRYYLRPC